MTVTDPDVPDPQGDPRTLQADPGAHGQGQDLASTEDDATSTGEDELATGDDEPVAGGGDVTGTALAEDEAFGPPVVGGAWSETPNT